MMFAIRPSFSSTCNLVRHQGIIFTLAVLLSMTGANAATTQKWTPGWDNFTKSNIIWSVNPTSKILTISFNLVGARPSKLYQVGVHFFCTTFPATFGQFPNGQPGGGACQTLTRQGVTKTITAFEFGVILTDIHGNGIFTVAIEPVASGTYSLEFDARDGAGCNVSGGAGNTFCALDFQSPGPKFGTTTKITIP